MEDTKEGYRQLEQRPMHIYQLVLEGNGLQRWRQRDDISSNFELVCFICWFWTGQVRKIGVEGVEVSEQGYGPF